MTEQCKIEAQTPGGPMSWQPYASRADAENDLARIKRLARGLGVVRDSWRIVPLSREGVTGAGASTLELAMGLDGRHIRIGQRMASVTVGQYASGEVAIMLDEVADGSAIVALTVQSGGRTTLGSGEILVNTRSKARGRLGRTWRGGVEAALGSGYFEDTGRRVDLGDGLAAVWRIKPIPGERLFSWRELDVLVKEYEVISSILGDRAARARRRDPPVLNAGGRGELNLVTPARLTAYLERRGWKLDEHREETSRYWWRPGGGSCSTHAIPVADAEVMAWDVETIAEGEDSSVLRVLVELLTASRDPGSGGVQGRADTTPAAPEEPRAKVQRRPCSELRPPTTPCADPACKVCRIR